MPMQLEGECHCGKVTFTVQSNTPVPFCRCYCSICRVCQGGGGYCINIAGLNDTLDVKGMDYVKTYRAPMDRSKPEKERELCGNRRNFCGECGSMLWAFDPTWEKWCYPFASAIETELPKPKDDEIVYIMGAYAKNWTDFPKEALKDKKSKMNAFAHYPDNFESIEEWHKQHGYWVD